MYEVETINKKQLKKLSIIFKATGRTFQSVATEVGIQNIPDHVAELTQTEGKLIIQYFRNFIK